METHFDIAIFPMPDINLADRCRVVSMDLFDCSPVEAP